MSTVCGARICFAIAVPLVRVVDILQAIFESGNNFE